MNSDSTTFPKQTAAPVAFQKAAESGLNELIRVGGFEAAFLYSPEGLPLAHSTLSHPRINELQVVEWVVLIAKMVRVMTHLGAIDSVHELYLEAKDGAKVVFRFVMLFEQPALLVLLVPTKKAYRGLTNRIAKAIEKWATFA